MFIAGAIVTQDTSQEQQTHLMEALRQVVAESAAAVAMPSRGLLVYRCTGAARVSWMIGGVVWIVNRKRVGGYFLLEIRC